MELRSHYDKVEISNGTITISDEKLDFKNIVDRLHAAGTIIRSAYVKEPTLEDIYLKITGKELRV